MADVRDTSGSLVAWSLDLEERYCEYRLRDGEHDEAREAMRHIITFPIERGPGRLDVQPEDHGYIVTYKGVYIGNIWPPDDWDDDPCWGNYPAPIIRTDSETPVTAGYSFDGDDGEAEAIRWFKDRLAMIGQGKWGREHGR